MITADELRQVADDYISPNPYTRTTAQIRAGGALIRAAATIDQLNDDLDAAQAHDLEHDRSAP